MTREPGGRRRTKFAIHFVSVEIEGTRSSCKRIARVIGFSDGLRTERMVWISPSSLRMYSTNRISTSRFGSRSRIVTGTVTGLAPPPLRPSRCACTDGAVNRGHRRETSVAIRRVLFSPVLIIVDLYYYLNNHITRHNDEKPAFSAVHG